MILTNKKEAFKQFYLSTEGKKMLALAEMFLDQLRLQIETGMVDNFNRDYRYQTEQYTFLYRFSCGADGSVQFVVHHRKRRYDMISVYYCPEVSHFLPEESVVTLDHTTGFHSSPALKLPYFDEVLGKVISVSESRIVDLFIPSELVHQIERKKMKYPEDDLAHAKHTLNQHRSAFTKGTFTSLAHTLKVIEETLPLMERELADVEQLKAINALSGWLSHDIPKQIGDHAYLHEEVRLKKESRLLEDFHRYYLKALDIRERS